MDNVPPNPPQAVKTKRKHFVWSTKPEWISGLLQIMCEYVDANMRSAQGFKDAVYKGVSYKLKQKFGIEVTPDQCKNQIRHQRGIWNHIQELKRKSGVSWDEDKKMILMGQEEYISHIQAFPKDVGFLNVPIIGYNELEKVCGEGHATGEWAKSGNSETSFGTQHVSLDDDECPSLMETYIDASQPVDSPDVDLTQDSTEKTKRSIPSSSKGFTKRKKSKNNESDQSMHNYIVMMADSVTQVANAIQSSTRDFKERQMFNELMTELSSIPGFSAEEIDSIYENLSNNPTMIRSFLARPKESKARWMQKELGR